MKILLKILFFIFLLTLFVGFYFQYKEEPIHKTILGIDILFLSFILMPLFIFYRYKNGKYKKYIIDPKSKNPFKIDDNTKL